MDGVQRADSLTGLRETAEGQSKLLLWLFADCLSSLAELDHCIIEQKASMLWKCDCNGMSFTQLLPLHIDAQ